MDKTIFLTRLLQLDELLLDVIDLALQAVDFVLIHDLHTVLELSCRLARRHEAD